MEETDEVPQMEQGFVRCWDLYTSEGRAEIIGNFLIVVLEKGGDQLGRSCE